VLLMMMVGDVVPLGLLVEGRQGTVFKFVRTGGRCPATEFLDGLDRGDLNKFKGSFNTFVKLGAEYENQIRFKGLRGHGKPLWEFKEHSQRIYSAREVFSLVDGNNRVQVAVAVLLSGWRKGRGITGREEKTQIESASTLYREYMSITQREHGKETPLATAIERARRYRR
jgi:hypothetical protein